MFPESESRKRLDTWQQIAAYLGVTPRTAQNYERRQGLPIYRLAGDKSRVWAFTDQLDAWQIASSTSIGVPSEAGIAGTIDKPRTRRHWLRNVIVPALGIGGLGVAFRQLVRNGGRPVTFDIDDSTLTALGADHGVLWQHTFPKPITEKPFENIPTGGPPYLLADLDGDGSMETVFDYTPKGELQSTLVCFDRDGHLRWQFTPGKTVTDTLSQQFAPPYATNCFLAFRLPGIRAVRILVVSAHNWSFACQVAVLDGQSGKLVSEYWHRGHLYHLAVADIDGDGQPEILLGGVNDAPEYKQATVVIFDGRNISGACRNPAGQSYYSEMAPGTEKSVVFFPRTAGSMDHEFNIVTGLRVDPDRILVTVSESGGADVPFWSLYELDYQLQPINLALSFDLQQLYTRLQGWGKLPSEPIQSVKDGLNKAVQVIRRS